MEEIVNFFKIKKFQQKHNYSRFMFNSDGPCSKCEFN